MFSFAVSLHHQYIHSVYIVSGWILFVLMRNRKNPTETFNSILAVVGVLSALYGLLQSTGYIETQSYFPVTGSFDNPAGFAASIVLCYPFLLCQTSNGKRKTLKFMAVSSPHYSRYLILVREQVYLLYA